MYVCMYICMHTCMVVFIYIQAYMRGCMYACMHICMYVCIYACMYVCIYICMYVYVDITECVVQVHVYTLEKPLNAGPSDGYFRRCQVTETEPTVDGATVCSFACGNNYRGCDYFTARVFGRYGPVRSLCEVELMLY